MKNNKEAPLQVSQKTIEKSIEILGGVLRIYREKIDQAFLKADGAMTVSLGIRYKPVDGKMGIKSSIKFVTDQVNDSFETMFDENMDELFPKLDRMATELEEGKDNRLSPYPIGQTKWARMPDCRIAAYMVPEMMLSE